MRETRTLPHALTELEIAERSDKLAHLWAKIEKLDDEKKEVVSQFKERRDEMEAAARQFAREIRERSADREVEVKEMADDKRFVIEWIRQDNLTVVESRPMTESEITRAKQGKLPFREPPPAKKPAEVEAEKKSGAKAAAEKPAETAPAKGAKAEPAAAPAKAPELRSVKGGAVTDEAVERRGSGKGPGAA